MATSYMSNPYRPFSVCFFNYSPCWHAEYLPEIRSHAALTYLQSLPPQAPALPATHFSPSYTGPSQFSPHLPFLLVQRTTIEFNTRHHHTHCYEPGAPLCTVNNPLFYRKSMLLSISNLLPVGLMFSTDISHPTPPSYATSPDS